MYVAGFLVSSVVSLGECCTPSLLLSDSSILERGHKGGKAVRSELSKILFYVFLCKQADLPQKPAAACSRPLAGRLPTGIPRSRHLVS